MTNTEETKQVPELTIKEIIEEARNYSGSASAQSCGIWAKSRSDEYWKQELAKKDLRMAELERKLEDFKIILITEVSDALSKRIDNREDQDVYLSDVISRFNNKSQL